jgi:hypothetical protein
LAPTGTISPFFSICVRISPSTSVQVVEPVAPAEPSARHRAAAQVHAVDVGGVDEDLAPGLRRAQLRDAPRVELERDPPAALAGPPEARAERRLDQLVQRAEGAVLVQRGDPVAVGLERAPEPRLGLGPGLALETRPQPRLVEAHEQAHGEGVLEQHRADEGARQRALDLVEVLEVRAHEVGLAPVEPRVEHEAVQGVVRHDAEQGGAERLGEPRCQRVQVRLVAAEGQHAQGRDHALGAVARGDAGLAGVHDADAEVVDGGEEVRQQPRPREVDPKRRGLALGGAPVEVERELRVAPCGERLEADDVAHGVLGVGRHAERLGEGRPVARGQRHPFGLAEVCDERVEQPVLPAGREPLDLRLEPLRLERAAAVLRRRAEVVEHGAPVLADRRAVVDGRGACALLEQLPQAAPQRLAVALAGQQHGGVEGAAVRVGPQHEPRVLAALGVDDLADQRGVALEVRREQELDRRRVEGGDQGLVAVGARPRGLLGEDGVEALGEEGHLRGRGAQRAEGEEPLDDGEARDAAVVAVLLHDDAVEARRAVDARLGARLVHLDDAGVGEEAADLLGHLGAALPLVEPAGLRAPPHAEAGVGAQGDRGAAVAQVDVVGAEPHQHEVPVEQPVEEADDLRAALGAAFDEAAGELYVGLQRADRAHEARVVVGHVGHDGEGLAQVRLERRVLLGGREARKELDVDQRLAPRVRALPEDAQPAPGVALHGEDGVEQELLGERPAAQREAHRVDEEGPVVLEHVDDAPARPVLGGVDADAQLPLAPRGAHRLEGLAGEAGEGFGAPGADGAGVDARQEGVGEADEGTARVRLERAGAPLQRGLEGASRRVARRRHAGGSVDDPHAPHPAGRLPCPRAREEAP